MYVIKDKKCLMNDYLEWVKLLRPFTYCINNPKDGIQTWNGVLVDIMLVVVGINLHL